MLKEQEASNIDNETGEKRYVTGDILELHKKILMIKRKFFRIKQLLIHH